MVALGHLHRRQSVSLAPCPVHYSGSPAGHRLRRGGEHAVGDHRRGGHPVGGPRPVRYRWSRAVPLRTVRGTLAELSKVDGDSAWLRVYVPREASGRAARAGAGAAAPGARGAHRSQGMLAETADGREGATPPGRRAAGRGAGRAVLRLPGRQSGHADPAVAETVRPASNGEAAPGRRGPPTGEGRADETRAAWICTAFTVFREPNHCGLHRRRLLRPGPARPARASRRSWTRSASRSTARYRGLERPAGRGQTRLAPSAAPGRRGAAGVRVGRGCGMPATRVVRRGARGQT